MDFTLEKYRAVLEMISSLKIPVYGISSWLKNNPKNGILLRHDVDRKAHNSLKMAKLEYEYSFATTYNFRITKGSFKPDIIRKISDLGHEIGYHYEDLSMANGDMRKAENLFKKNLKKLRKYGKVESITMHGRPFSTIDNRDMWKELNLSDYELIGEAFLSIDYEDIFYFTDTGRSWLENSSNIRDHVDHKFYHSGIKSTDHLIEFISSNRYNKIAIVAHPERWGINFNDWLIQSFKDKAINLIKNIIKKIL